MSLTQHQKKMASNMVAAFVTEFEFSGYYLQLCDAMYSQANHSSALCDIIYDMFLANVMDLGRIHLLVNMRMLMIGQALVVLMLENGRIILTNLGAEFPAQIANLFRMNGQVVALFARDLLFRFSMCMGVSTPGFFDSLPPRPINMFRSSLSDAQLILSLLNGMYNGGARTLNRSVEVISNPYEATISYFRFFHYLLTNPLTMGLDIVEAAKRSFAEDPVAFCIETFLNALLIHFTCPLFAPPGGSLAVKLANVTMNSVVNVGHNVRHSTFLIAHSGHHAGAILQAGPPTGQGPIPAPVMMCSIDPTSNICAGIQQAGVAHSSVNSGLALNLTQVSQSHHTVVQQTLLSSTTGEAAASGGLTVGAAVLAHNLEGSMKSYRHKFYFEIEIQSAPCESFQVSLQKVLEVKLLRVTVEKARHSGLSSSMKEALAWMGKPKKKDIKPVSDVVKIKQRTDAFERYQRKRR